MSRALQACILCLLLALLLGGMTVLTHAIFEHNTPGIDYYIFWTAGRAFFQNQDPYAPEVDRQIQLGLYGHEAGPGENRMEFAYPPNALFILLPILWLDFAWSQAAWMSFNILLVLSLAYGLFPRAPRWLRLSFPFLYPFVFGYVLGNFVVTITAFLLVFARAFSQRERPGPGMQILLGVLVAWCAVKPQSTWGFLILFLLYAIRERLWKMLASFFAGGALMGLAALFFRADWPVRWLEQVTAYQDYNDTLSVLSRYLARMLPAGAVEPLRWMILALCAGLSIYLLLRWWQGKLEPLLLVAWVGFVTFLVHPGGGGGVSYQQLVFLMPFFLWTAYQKPSIVTGLVWAGGWIFSYLCNYPLLFHLPGWFEQLYFPAYAAWLGWIFTRQAARTRLIPQQDAHAV